MPHHHSNPQPWYREAFQEGYVELYGHRDLAEAARAVLFLRTALELKPPQRLLDLCCGPGRHLFFLGRVVREAVGLDLSRVLLRNAREHWQAGRSAVESVSHPERTSSPVGWMLGEQAIEPRPDPMLVHATMSRLPFPDAMFDRVVNLFTSFGYYEEEAKNQSVLGEIARVLKPGGRLAIDHINREAMLAGLKPETERELPGDRHVLERRRWNAATRRVVKQVTLHQPGEPPREWSESVRVYEPAELESMLEVAGLKPAARHGDYTGAPWQATSPRLLILAERG